MRSMSRRQEATPRKNCDDGGPNFEAAYRGTPTFPVTISLAEHVRQLSIPQAYFEELIKGVEMDLTASRYASFQDLSLYCYRVASVVGLICLHIFGPTSARAQDYAVNLGMAFQLTNILRDIGTDAAQGRIYLPQEDLEKFGCTDQAILQRQESTELRNVASLRNREGPRVLCKGTSGVRSPTGTGPAVVDCL